MKRDVLVGAASILLGLSLAAQSFAQQIHNLPPDPYDPQHTAASAAQQPALPAANDYPAAEVQAVPMARVRLAVARAQFEDAQSGLHQLIDQFKEDFEYSADLGAALRNQKAAHELYEAARDRVMVQVNADSDYQTSKNLYDDLSEKLENLKDNAAANKTEILATARLRARLWQARQRDRVRCAEGRRPDAGCADQVDRRNGQGDGHAGPVRAIPSPRSKSACSPAGCPGHPHRPGSRGGSC